MRFGKIDAAFCGAGRAMMMRPDPPPDARRKAAARRQSGL